MIPYSLTDILFSFYFQQHQELISLRKLPLYNHSTNNITNQHHLFRRYMLIGLAYILPNSTLQEFNRITQHLLPQLIKREILYITISSPPLISIPTSDSQGDEEVIVTMKTVSVVMRSLSLILEGGNTSMKKLTVSTANGEYLVKNIINHLKVTFSLYKSIHIFYSQYLTQIFLAFCSSTNQDLVAGYPKSLSLVLFIFSIVVSTLEYIPHSQRPAVGVEQFYVLLLYLSEIISQRCPSSNQPTAPILVVQQYRDQLEAKINHLDQLTVEQKQSILYSLSNSTSKNKEL